MEKLRFRINVLHNNHYLNDVFIFNIFNEFVMHRARNSCELLTPVCFLMYAYVHSTYTLRTQSQTWSYVELIYNGEIDYATVMPEKFCYL